MILHVVCTQLASVFLFGPCLTGKNISMHVMLFWNGQFHCSGIKDTFSSRCMAHHNHQTNNSALTLCNICIRMTQALWEHSKLVLKATQNELRKVLSISPRLQTPWEQDLCEPCLWLFSSALHIINTPEIFVEWTSDWCHGWVIEE